MTNGKLKRVLCLLLSLVLLLQAAPATRVQAQTVQVPLPEVQIVEEILANNLFYLASTAATLREGANETYLLRVGRGGGAETESSVLVKISDVTAKYGRDYTISVLNGSEKVRVPENNVSLMELIAGQPFELTELKDEKEAEAIFAEDEAGMAAAEAGVAEALNYLSERSGLADAEAAVLDPVQQARNRYTGKDGSSQRVTASEDMFQQLQSVANVMTEVVPGAGVTLTFGPGETEKLLEITVKDNRESDGNRMLYVILAETDGSTTNSAASTCALTIEDDEEQVPAVVSFSQDTYSEVTDGMVTVTLHREGALNQVVTARVRSAGGTATAGRDYSEVDREILFPFGVSDMPLQIPVSTSGFEGAANFELTLEPEVGCTAAQQNAVVQLVGSGAASSEAATSRKPDTRAIGDLMVARTGTAISLSKYADRWDGGSVFSGHNQYNSSGGYWEMDWKDTSDFLHYATGDMAVSWDLDEDSDPLWYNGAQVEWQTTSPHNNHHATFNLYNGKPLVFLTDRSNTFYSSAQAFDRTKVDFYVNSVSGGFKNFFLYYTRDKCDDCNWLWIYSIKPILRPFHTTLLPVEDMEFLQEDGSYAASKDDPAVDANIKDAILGERVLYLGDSVTVKQNAADNVTRYLYLKGLEYIPADKPENAFTVETIGDLSATSVALELSKENLKKMFRTEGSRFVENTELLSQLKSGTNGKFYSDSFSRQVPSYAELQLRPMFEYIDSRIALQNPYDFPVCFSISGTDYWVNPKDMVELKGYHLGDVFAVTKLTTAAGYNTDYTAVGVDAFYSYTANTENLTPDPRVFSDGKAIYFGGKDHRLAYEELVLSPVLTEKKTQIVVRVKTSELPKFEDEALLKMEHTVNGEYTEFFYTKPGQMIPGRTYPITVVPKTDDTVCVWTLYSGLRYVGDSLLFTAGKAGSAEENTITLSTAAAKSSVELTGTLTYRDYNLRTKDSGTASNRPAVGAVVVAGNMRAETDENGNLSSSSMKVPSSPHLYRVRCMITVNGTSVIRDATLPRAGKTQLNISSTFDTGVSPAQTPIFQTVTIDIPEMTNNDGQIPLGNSDEFFTVNVGVKPVRYSVQRPDGEGGFFQASYYEKPLSAQLIMVGQDGEILYKLDEITQSSYDSRSGQYVFSQQIPFEIVVPVVDEDGTQIDVTVYEAKPGDRLFLRLTTDLLSQTEDMELPPEALALLEETESGIDADTLQVNEYVYSEVNTGYTIYSANTYTEPVEQGLQEPVKLDFTSLPLLGDVGMNLQFPFVNVGWQVLDTGYRMYIGISPVQIIQKIKNSPIARYKGDDGFDWATQFSMAHPFKTWGDGIKNSAKKALDIGQGAKDGTTDVGSLGARQWRFDFTLGIYFDFCTPVAVDRNGLKTTTFRFDGMGGYVSATVGVKQAWYAIIPVVFIPGYFGVLVEINLLGAFGVHAKDDVPNVITYDDAKTVPKLDFESNFNDEFHYNLTASGMFQISLGVGLCGTIGVRFVAEVDAIVDYEETQLESVRPWGAYIKFRGGGMIDLFLTSVPLMYDLVGLKLGKFYDLENRDDASDTELRGPAAHAADPFRLRAGAEETSEWLGNGTQTRGAFTPKQTYTLVENSYERADPQLITLKNGTVVLAYLSNDPDKGPYQRTTLMLTSCRNGVWREPVAVSTDGTADFQPSIAETGDGRVLVAWVSTEAADITEETPTVDYLHSMEVYAAFAEIGADGSISVGETARISHDRRTGEGQDAHYYDANPTVLCDAENGDAIIYYIKSGSVTEDPSELANPYANDSVICYLPYDSAKGKWMTDEFYADEIYGETPEEVAENEQFLIDNFCGQRFLDAPTFETADGGREYYSIPDFTAVGENGMAIYAYTVDRDSSNDTDVDKELFLQVYSFRDHHTYYQIRLTDDVVADAMPQLICSDFTDGEETKANTKLFWYRGGQGIAYIDVSDLLANGINSDGTLKEKEDGSGNLAQPILVSTSYEQTQHANQMADFRVIQDAHGSLYIIWTEAVSGGDEDAQSAQELFAISRYVDPANPDVSNWSKPYQLTNSGLQNDEVVLTLAGSDLLLVHNQYALELTDDENQPIALSDMRLAATTLEPCGAVKANRLLLLEPAGEHAEEGALAAVTLPRAGQNLTVELVVSNDGLTTAEGYHVDVYQVTGAGETLVWSEDEETRLLPNHSETLRFDWTVPQAPDGAFLRVETTENNYTNRDVFTSEPLQARADYSLEHTSVWQAEDGFHLRGLLTNNGNAETGDGEMLTIRMDGPFDLSEYYSWDERTLYQAPIEKLAVGESRPIEAVLQIPADMLARDGYVTASAAVTREIPAVDLLDRPATETEYLSNGASVEFRVRRPVEFRIGDGTPISLAVAEEKPLTASLELGELLGGDEVRFTVDDVNVARVEEGKLVGISAGETTLYATHMPTRASVSVPVTVTDPPATNPFTDVKEGKFYYEPVLWAYYHDPQITAGTGETTFSPNGGATRAQVVTFLWRAAGCPEPTTDANPFSDVPDGKYYTKPVLWAVEAGIAKGTGAGSFSPGKTCTRGEFVTFLYRFAGEPQVVEGDNPFTDVSEGTFCYEAVLWAVKQEITAGTTATTFSPNNKCTRGQIVTFLYRYMGA